MAAACRSCGQPVAWAVTDAGKAIPLDADPAGDPLVVPDGNLEATPGPLFSVRHVIPGELNLFDLFEPPTRYRTHFATCPEAASWRKPK